MAHKATRPKGMPPKAGTGITSIAQALVGTLRNLSLYAAPCLSGGALMASFHEILNLELTTAFTLGFFSLVGPIYWTYASGWGMRRTLAQILAWEQCGLIDASQAKRLRDRAIDWYIARRF
jgi:hypothetical protein